MMASKDAMYDAKMAAAAKAKAAANANAIKQVGPQGGLAAGVIAGVKVPTFPTGPTGPSSNMATLDPTQYPMAEIITTTGEKVMVYTGGPLAGQDKDGNFPIQATDPAAFTSGATGPTVPTGPTGPTGPTVTKKLISTYTDPDTGDIIDVYEDGTEVVRRKGTVKEKIVSTYTDEETGDVIDVYEDGIEVVRRKGTVKADAKTAADALAAERVAGRLSAYDILYREFKANGLESLVEAAKNVILNEDSDSGRILALRSSPAYAQRFSANEQRKLKGLAVLDERSYLAMEDQYQELMRQYGLPESYYAKDSTGKQVGFEQLIANDVSNIELNDRLMVAQDRVVKSNPEVLQALKDFYPDINNGDILAYTLDPKNAIKDIQRKVTSAEIGGAAIQSGLGYKGDTPEAIRARAEELQRYGVDKAAATAGFATIGAGLQRGSELASIYQQDPYTQTTAESEIFNIPGAKEARKQRQKVTGLEKATFGGQSGITSGALARDRAGGY